MTCGSRDENVWSIVLAGGDGERLKPFVRQWLGYEKPKQYCRFVGTLSMLEHTLDRADRISEPEHKVTIVARNHRRCGWTEPLRSKPGRLILQPFDLGTATAVFLSLAYIRRETPNATVVLYPSDHFVYPEDHFLNTASRRWSRANTPREAVTARGCGAWAGIGLWMDSGW
jgi:mannose-1-phosphate guanylyltransferase